MTTVSQIIGQAQFNAGSVAPSGGSDGGGKAATATRPSQRSDVNDGYKSFGGSVLRSAGVGAISGAAIGMVVPPIGVPIGAGIGAAVGAGSALIRSPKVASAVGDGMKAMVTGAAGGALVGTISPFGPIGGMVAGAAGGFLTGTVSSALKNVAGGKLSIENEKSVVGRIAKGFALGAVSGATVGAGAGLLFGGIGALPGALWGAVIGGVGGAFHGATTGVVDAATGAKGVTLTGSGSSKPGQKPSGGNGFQLPSLPTFGSGTNGPGDSMPTYPGQGGPSQYQNVNQCAPRAM